MGACQRGAQPERAFDVFAALQQQRVLPNVITYCALITASERSTQPERGFQVF